LIIATRGGVEAVVAAAVAAVEVMAAVFMLITAFNIAPPAAVIITGQVEGLTAALM